MLILPARDPASISRRVFLRQSSMAVAGALGTDVLMPALTNSRAALHDHFAQPASLSRNPLRRATELSPYGVRLNAQPGNADIGGGVNAPGWLINGTLPSPLIRVQRGDNFSAELVNGLEEPLILHWHGLTPPEQSDGHPRLAVPPRGTYNYQFPIENRAGSYWYHSHVHHRVAYHTQMGIAGMIIVHDDEEAALNLPRGEREIPIILQDRKLGSDGLPQYHNPDLMEGYHGKEPFGNGIHRPYLDVETALYRFRILNGANARIFRLELSDRRDMILIGNDAGLLHRPATVQSIDVAPGERVDVLIDMRSTRVGDRITLRSRPFTVGGMIPQTSTHDINDVTLDLLELRVARAVRDNSPVPSVLPEVALPDPARAVRERTFSFAFARDYWSRSMERHSINDIMYDMNRMDVVVPFDQTEIWTFVNDFSFAHPVHLHATHFRVLSRSGGRGAVFPWEQGLKDTVLIHPNESVRVAVRFTAHRGLFLLHCHNLEHEDAGMMLNVLVE